MLALAIFAAGCGGSGPQTTEAPRSRIPLEPAMGGGAAWLPDGWLVVSRAREPDLKSQLFRVRPDGSGLQPLPIPGDPACLSIDLVSPISLGDGRIAFLWICGKDFGPDEVLVKAFDPATGETSPLVAGPLNVASGVITWNIVKGRGMIGDPIAPCMTIAWLTPEGMEPAPITISEGDRSWWLDELLKGSGSDCDDLGNAGYPAWSPDGSTIAFFASPAAMGDANQFSRLDAPWNLYLMSPDDLRPRKSLEGVVGANESAWSPDGKWLAFSGTIGGREGAWVYAPSTGSLVRISAGEILPQAWSPDGKVIAAYVLAPKLKDTQLVVLDVGALLSKAASPTR